MAKFATNARGAMLLLNLIQVTESISGSVVPLAMFIQIYSDIRLCKFIDTNIFGYSFVLKFSRGSHFRISVQKER